MLYPTGFISYLRGCSVPAQNRSRRSGSDRRPKPVSSSSFFIQAVRIIIILIMILSVLIFYLGGMRGLYPRYGKIVGIEYDRGCYLIEDACGLVWEYGGIEDFAIGEDIAMLMWDHMSPEFILDDVILEMR